MKRFTINDLFIVLGVIVFCVSMSGICSAEPGQWTSIGPYGGNVFSLSVDPATPDTLYAGTDGSGAYRYSVPISDRTPPTSHQGTGAVEGAGGCFIATAAYQTPMESNYSDAHEISFLRNYHLFFFYTTI